MCPLFGCNSPLSGDDENDAAAAVAAAAKAAAEATDWTLLIGGPPIADIVEFFDEVDEPSIADHGKFTGTGGVGDTYFLLARGATSLT